MCVYMRILYMQDKAVGFYVYMYVYVCDGVCNVKVLGLCLRSCIIFP